MNQGRSAARKFTFNLLEGDGEAASRVAAAGELDPQGVELGELVKMWQATGSYLLDSFISRWERKEREHDLYLAYASRGSAQALEREHRLAHQAEDRDKTVPLANVATLCGSLFEESAAQHRAALIGLRALRDQDADLDGVDCFGKSPLLLAVYCGSMSLVEELVDCGADPDGRVQGRAPLEYALNENHHDIAYKLIEAGADVGQSNLTGGTPLMLAVIDRQADLVRLLLSKGARTDPRTAEGYSALELAILKGRKEMVELLIELGVTPDGRTMKVALSYGDQDPVERLRDTLDSRPGHGDLPKDR